MEQRSIFVTVVGWIFIVISAFFLLDSVLFLFIPFDKFMPKTAPQPGMPVPDPALVLAFMHGMFFIMATLAAWVLLSAIGLVMRKNWARISFIVVLVLGLGFCGIYVLFGVMTLAFMPAAGLPGQPPEMAGLAHSVVRVMTVFSGVLAALYGWILYKLNTDRIKAEFLPEPKPNQ